MEEKSDPQQLQEKIREQEAKLGKFKKEEKLLRETLAGLQRGEDNDDLIDTYEAKLEANAHRQLGVKAFIDLLKLQISTERLSLGLEELKLRSAAKKEKALEAQGSINTQTQATAKSTPVGFLSDTLRKDRHPISSTTVTPNQTTEAVEEEECQQVGFGS
jgi:hypothetical protein